MSAVELLEEAKKLPEAERDQLIEGLLAFEPETQPQGGFVCWPDIEARAKLIVGDKIFENIILEERASRDY